MSSVALIELCQERGALYLDTCIEPWPGGYTDPSLPPSARSNYALRESALALRRELGRAARPRSCTHGANPGLVSHFVKQALLDRRARRRPRRARRRPTAPDWARLAAAARRQGRSTSPSATRRSRRRPKEPGEFVNTWSIDGFVSEGSQPAELGWGTHERHFPADGAPPRFRLRCGDLPDAAGRGDARAQLDAARRALSRLSDHPWRIDLDRRLPDRCATATRCVYRPTCHYAYHPCDDAVLCLHELAGKNWQLQTEQAADDGGDRRGHRRARRAADGARARASTGTARGCRSTRRGGLAPHNNATSLQVTAAVLAGMVWAIEHPTRGHRRARRDGFRARPRDRRALSRRGRRRLRRLDAARRPRGACSRKTSTATIPGSSRTSGSADSLP